MTATRVMRIAWVMTGLWLALSATAQVTETGPKKLQEIKTMAEEGDAAAQYKLGYAYAYGKGVEKDYAEAAKWFRLAAEQNDATGQCNLGVAYADGLGVAKDEAEAVKWYRKAAEQNYAVAQYNLGFMYNTGRGVAKDEAEAVKWFRKAAEQNEAAAQYKLGYAYANGQSVAKDDTEAVKWLRKAAEQNYAAAQYGLGEMYANGRGVEKDDAEAVKWYRKATEQNVAAAQSNLGVMYSTGRGVAKDEAEAVKWFRKAAEQNVATGQCNLGVAYRDGLGVVKDDAEAGKWFRKAAEQNDANGQCNLGVMYAKGEGVEKDYVEGYAWFNLAAKTDATAAKNRTALEGRMTREQVAEAQRRTKELQALVEARSKGAPAANSSFSVGNVDETIPRASGTGFFITEDGYLVTNEHVVVEGESYRVLTAGGLRVATLVKVDKANDLAVLKVEGRFAAMPVVSSRTVKLGLTVCTVGFPNMGLQGYAPKLAKGEVASLAGAQDDPKHFQISVPVQPGNSGGPLVDARGNVVGVVVAKLSAAAMLKATGQLPENVNYAVKSSFLLSFLESMPELAAGLKEPNTREMKFEEVVGTVEKAVVLVLVY